MKIISIVEEYTLEMYTIEIYVGSMDLDLYIRYIGSVDVVRNPKQPLSTSSANLNQNGDQLLWTLWLVFIRLSSFVLSHDGYVL